MSRALLLGLGASAQAARVYLEPTGYEIATYDDRRPADYDLPRLKRELPLFELGVVSPGIRYNSAARSLARLLCRRESSELSLALAAVRGQLLTIGVTGSNGKTSTVTFLAALLEKLGYKVLVAGNIGRTLADRLDQLASCDVLLVEISSFQAELLAEAHFDLLIYTTASPNHLDCYRSAAEYYAAKKRLALQADRVLSTAAAAALQLDSAVLIEELLPSSAALTPAGRDFQLALGAVALLGHDPSRFADFDYRPLIPVSRYQQFLRRGAIEFVDDSKATSLEASASALAAEPGPTVLILGGHLKSASLDKLRADRIMIYGPERERFAACCSGAVELYPDLAELTAALLSGLDPDRKTRVLFAPGGSSLLYRDYKERGADFRRLVREYYGPQN